MRSKADGSFWGRNVEKEDGELAVGGRMEQGGGITVWVEAASDGGAAGAFDGETLGADGDAPIGADFGLRALAPDVGPPRAVWGGAQDGAFLVQSQLPCGLRGGAQFAVAFLLVVVKAAFFEQDIGFGQRGDVLGGEEWREALLPEMGVEIFAFVEACTGDDSAVIVHDLDRRTVARWMAKSWRRSASEAARLQEQGGTVVRSLRRVAATGSGSGARWLPPEDAGLQEEVRRLAQAAR